MKTSRFVVSLLTLVLLLFMCMWSMRSDAENKQSLQPDPSATCPLAEYQHLIGKPESDIPEALKGNRQFRVVCHNCPVTMDYNPTRLNILLDESGKVDSLRCG